MLPVALPLPVPPQGAPAEVNAVDNGFFPFPNTDENDGSEQNSEEAAGAGASGGANGDDDGHNAGEGVDEYSGEEAGEDGEDMDANGDAVMEVLEEMDEVHLDPGTNRFIEGGHYLGRRTGLIEGSAAVLWSLLQINGSRRLTVDQYGSVRALMQGPRLVGRALATSQSGILPHFTTLTRTILPNVLRVLAVHATEVLVPVDMSTRGAHTYRTIDGVPHARLSLVQPLEYAKYDMRDPQFFHELVESVAGAEEWPIIRGREYFYGPISDIELDADGNTAEVGDVVSVEVRSREGIREPFCSTFEVENDRVIKGKILSIFQSTHIHQEEVHASVAPNDDLDARTLWIRNVFSRVEYRWGEGEPEIQPSDLIVVLGPTTTAVQCNGAWSSVFHPWNGQ